MEKSCRNKLHAGPAANFLSRVDHSVNFLQDVQIVSNDKTNDKLCVCVFCMCGEDGVRIFRTKLLSIKDQSIPFPREVYYHNKPWYRHVENTSNIKVQSQQLSSAMVLVTSWDVFILN